MIDSSDKTGTFGLPHLIRVSDADSRRVASLRPGPGLPISKLPTDVQRQVREGLTMPLEELLKLARD
jgi:hypothetical protein